MSGYERIVVAGFGGPEVLELAQVEGLPVPGDGEARIRVEVAGVGYTDTIVRRGRYIDYKGGLPLTPGYDVVGIVDELGPGATSLRIGQRVCDMPVTGAYSQYMIRSVETLVPVPDAVSADAAIEVPLMAMTAWQMLKRVAALPPRATVLVVGASGAVGRPLVRLARRAGLTVIGTCSARNLALVEGLGATAIDHARADLPDAIRAAGGGQGVAAAFDAIGIGSWDTSWAALAHGGILVGYGFLGYLEATAPTENPLVVMARFHQTWNEEGRADGTDRRTTFYDIRVRRDTHPDEYREDAIELLDMIATGTLEPDAVRALPLADAAEAHRLIASGGLDRRLVLHPWRGSPAYPPDDAVRARVDAIHAQVTAERAPVAPEAIR